MIKRFLASISILAMFALVLPTQVLAVGTQDLITKLDLTVPLTGATIDKFDPSVSGQVLKITPTFDSATIGSSSTGYVKVVQVNGATKTDIKTLATWTTAALPSSVPDWDGKCGTVICPSGSYEVEAKVEYTDGSSVLQSDTEIAAFTIDTFGFVTAETTVSTSSSDTDTVFDPADSAGNEDLLVKYSLKSTPSNVTIQIKDALSQVVKTSTFSTINGTLTWDGLSSSKLVLPGTYTAVLTASKSGATTVTTTKTFDVTYSNNGKGEIQNFKVVPDSFDPDNEDAAIEFKNTADSDITVEIQDASGTVLRSFDGYKNDNFNAGDLHSIVWDGKTTGGSDISLGSYKVVVVTRNNFGVVASNQVVTVNNSAGTILTSNAHISDISFSPSSKFKPSVDEDLRIRYDVKQDLDSLKIYAIRGSDKIELLDEDNIDKESNIEIFWDGTDDDDEYAAAGSWKIQFESKVDSTELKAAKSITVQYDKPNIDELVLSKSKFDNDIGEFTSIMFKVDEDATVNIKVMLDNVEDEDIEEDMDVEKDKWYAVTWDGGGYDYEDDLDIKLIAQNKANEDIYDSEKISVDLAEDTVTSSKSNVTQDYISPTVTDGYEEMEIGYEIEDDANVAITIQKGSSSSGSKVIELLNISDQESGSHVITWDGKDKSGNKLSDGFYTYKIVSYKSSSDTETGLFVVGKVGDEGSSSVSTGSGSSSNGGDNVGNGVVVDGGNDNGGDIAPPTSSTCSGFADVSASSTNCAAISWVKSEGVFQGYGNGTFGEYQPINRAEALKVIMEALSVGPSATSTNLGFKDVQIGAWYMAYINSAKNIGIFQGDAGKGTARPDEKVNRAEILKLMFETLNKTSGFAVSECGFAYTDVAQDAWYHKYVCGSKQFSLFGLPDGLNFMANSYATRAEVAQMFYKLHLAGLI